jgi:7-carboxy-7-deazaguanine synthase
MRVTEIFHSIQGESTHAGKPCVFVRFTGCDLRCQYCDTAYAFHGGREMSEEEILEAVGEYSSRFVCLTGGEPMLQKGIEHLAAALVSRGYLVTVETHGQAPFDRLPEEVVKIVDIKTPGSGEVQKDFTNLARLSPRDEVKIVVTSFEDFLWAVEVVKKYRLEERGPLLFSPSWGQVDPKDLAAWLLESGLDARLQLQQHKYIWGPDVQGV